MARIIYAAALLALLNGCDHWDYSVPGALSHDGWQYSDAWGTEGCIDSERSARWHSAAVAAALQYEATSSSPLIATLPWHADMLLERPNLVVCRTREPVQCCVGGLCFSPGWASGQGAYGPNGESVRPAGCFTLSSFYLVQFSENYPPVCRPSWPDEPRCVSSAADEQRRRYDAAGAERDHFATEWIHYYAFRVIPEIMSQEDEQRLWDAWDLGLLHRLITLETYRADNNPELYPVDDHTR